MIEYLRRDYSRLIIESLTEIGRPRLQFANAQGIAARVLALFDAGEFDVATIVYNRFKSAMTVSVTPSPLKASRTKRGAWSGIF